MKRPGVSVIEVLVAIGLAAVVIAVIGNLIGATHRLTTATGKELQATALAKQWVEVVSGQANQQFGCSCGATNPCAGNTCMTAGQTCTPRPGFNSCWVPAPLTIPFTFSGGGPWTYSDSPTGFIRHMTVENLQRDGSGALVTAGTVNPDSKRITVRVCWGDNDCTDINNNRNHVQVSTILTAWKNF